MIDRVRVCRSVSVYVALSTLTLDGEGAQATLDAIDSKGMSEVVKVLGADEPPQRIVMGPTGYLGGTVPAAAA